MTKIQEKSLDGTYTEMLRMVLGVSWKDEVSNDVLYGKLPKLSGQRIRNRRLKLAGHCALRILNLWLMIQLQGNLKQGEGRPNWINKKEELRTLMRDRDIRRKISAVDRT